MPDLEFWFLCLTIAGLAVGTLGIIWARGGQEPRRRLQGRWVFLIALLVLGVSTIAAALDRADGLVPLGLTAGFLVVGMVWDIPRPAAVGSEAIALRDQG